MSLPGLALRTKARQVTFAWSISIFPKRMAARLRRIRPAMLAMIILGMTSATAFADKRIALVIGNGAYQNVARLENPANDAKLMADTLRSLGFVLIGGGAQINLDKTSLDNAIASFGSQVVGADVGLFYYAGHGVQVRNSNFLVPVGANPAREADVYVQMTDVAVVLSQMEGSGTKLNLVILDACRNNPFGSRGLRATDPGLAQIRAPEGTLISYATQPGNVAKDGTDGNSPYTKALAQTIRRSGLDIFQTFNEVGLAVKRATGGDQQPWVSNSPIDGSFYFGGTPAAPAANIGPASDEVAWGFVKDSKDADQVRRFIEQFATSARRGEATSKLFALERNEQKAAVVAPPVSPMPPSPSVQPPRSTATSEKTTENPCRKIIGRWAWINSGGTSETVFGSGGTGQNATFNLTNTWTCSGGIAIVRWSNGGSDRVTISRDGNSLSILNPYGQVYSATRN
jgi:Caspase domain